MDTLWIDPQVQKLDDLIGKAYQDLYNDIKDHGIRSPIIASRQDGSITDGHNRFRVCTALGITIPDDKIFYKDYGDKEEQILDGIKINILRRDVSAENRDKLIKAYFEIKPNVSTRSASKELQVSRRKAEGLRPQVVQKGQNEPPAKREGKDGKQQSVKKKTSAPKPDFPIDNTVAEFLSDNGLSYIILEKHKLTIPEQRSLHLKLASTLDEYSGSSSKVKKLALEGTVRAYIKNLKAYQREQKAEQAKGYIGKLIKSKHRDLPDLYEFTFTLGYGDMRHLRAYIKEKDSGSIEKHDLDYHLTELVRDGAIVVWGDNNDG